MAVGRTNRARPVSVTLTIVASGSLILSIATGDPMSISAATTSPTLESTSDSVSSERLPLVRVTVDIYSGLPNPSWEILNDDAQSLIARMRGLPKAKRQIADEPGLGYRGLILEVNDETGPIEYRVFGGIVTTDSDSFLDEGRDLERFLIRSGSAVLGQDLVVEIIEQL